MMVVSGIDRSQSKNLKTSRQDLRQRRKRKRQSGLRFEQLENRVLLAVANDDLGAVLADGTLTSLNDYPPKVLADNPVAYWRLDETNGASASDVVGGLDGTISGGVTLAQAGPLASTSTAFAFNGTNGKIDVPHNAALNPAGSFSIEGWARVDGGDGGFRSMITSRDDINAGADTRGYILYAANNNTWQFWTGTGGAVGRPGPWDVLNGPAIVNGQWTHIAMSYLVTSPPDAEGVYRGVKSLYIDGQLVAQAADAFYEPNQVEDLHIAAGADTGNSFFFNGLIDEVAFYDRGLTASEVQAHASAGLLGNDQDADPNDTLAVVAVNGDQAAVGNLINAPSGALVTINADGSYAYDPNGAFNALSAGQTDTDTISYTVSDTAGTLNDGLLAHWALNGDAGNSAGDDHQGAIIGAPAAVAGQIGEALDFPGVVDNRVDVPHSSALNPASFTFSAWAMAEGGQGGYRSLVTSRDDIAGDQRGYIIYAANTDTWQFWTGRGSGGGGWDNLTGPAVVLNQWTHVAISFQATSGPNAGGDYQGIKTLYIDGQLAGSQIGSYEPNEVEALHLGAGNDAGNSFFFDGLIDDVGLWNRALTATEVQNIFDSGQAGDDLPEIDTANLVVTVTGVGEGSVTNEAPTATNNIAAVGEHGPFSDSGNLITDDDGSGVDRDNDVGSAVLVTPASVTLEVGSEFYAVGNLVNDSGLSGAADIANYASVTHAGSSASTAWVTDGFFPDYYAGGGLPPVLTFDLGGSVNLTDAVFWNYSVPGNAARTITMEFSTNGPGGPFSNPVTVESPQAAGPAHAVALGGTFEANAVRFTFDNNWRGVGAGGDRVGLAEVKFIGVMADGLRVSDIDGHTDPAADVNGLYGSLAWDSDGSYTYNLDENHPSVRTLAGGATLTETFTYTIADQHPVVEGLVLHANLDEASGAATALDISGNGLNGSINGAAVAQAGQIGAAYDFNSAAETVDLGSPAALNALTNNLTVSAWINPDNLGGIQRFFSINPGAGWGFGANGANLRFTTYGVKDYDLALASPLLNNVWTHVAAVMDGGNTVEFYVNGSSVGTLTHTAAGNPGSGSWYLGGRGPGGEAFDGRIDDLAVWSRPLTAAEVAAIHASGVSGTSFQETDQAALTVTVVGVNDAPVATNNSADVVADGPLSDSGNLLSDDDGFGVDGDNESGAVSLVTPASVTLDTGSEFFVVGNLVNDSGLSAPADIDNYASVTHAGSSGANAWVTDAFFPDYYAGGGPTPVLTFDLGGSATLTDAVFWNYSIPGNATRTITMEFSTNGVAGPFANPVTVETPQAAGPAHTVSLGGSFAADAVRFTFDNNWRGVGAGGDRVGLAEVKFIGALTDSVFLTDVEDQTDPAAPVAGQYGSLQWSSDGGYTYNLDNNHPDVQSLFIPSTLTDTFTYTIADRNSTTDALVLHAPLDEAAGAAQALDISGNELHGTVNGASSDQPGALDRAYDFDGATNNIDLGSPAALNALTNSLSVSAWINPDSLGGIQRFFSINPGGGWGFGANGGNLRFTTYGVRDYDLALAAPLANDVWTHVAAVMDSSNTVEFFVNGVSVGSLAHAAPGNPGSGAWYIGGRGPGGEGFNGQLDDVAVWSRDLSAQEIAGIYASGLAGNSFQETADAVLEVTIGGKPRPITANDDSINAPEDGAPGPLDVTAELLANDDADTRIIAVDAAGTTGTVRLDGSGNVSYDPNGQFESLPVGGTATDSFSYTLAPAFTPNILLEIPSGNLPANSDAPNNVLATLTNADLGDARTITIDFVSSRDELSGGDTWFAVALNPGGGTRGMTGADLGWLVRGTAAPDTSAHQMFDDGANVASAPSASFSTTSHITATVWLPAGGIAAGNEAMIRVQYDDGDDGSIDATLTHQFTIDVDSLAIGIAAHNKSYSYENFTVSSFSQADVTDTATVTVTIDGQNDPPTVAGPTAYQVFDSRPDSIFVSGADIDVGDALTLSITGGADQGAFSFNPATGELAFAIALDFDAPADANGDNIYEVQITATDPSNASGSQTLFISVLPGVEATVNVGEDDGPTDITADLRAAHPFQGPARFTSVTSDGLVGQVAVDADGRVIYDPNGQFESLGVGETASESFTVDLELSLPTANLTEHFDAGSITGVNDGDTLSAWADSALDDGTAQDAVAGGDPTYQANVVNGYPVVRFDGDTDEFRTVLGPNIGANDGFAYFVVVRRNGTLDNGATNNGGGDYILDRNFTAPGASQSGNPLVSLKAVGGGYGYQTRYDNGSGLGGPNSDSAISASEFQIVVLRRNVADGKFELWVDGTLEGTVDDNGTPLTPDPIVIGRHATNPALGLNGDIAEVLVYDDQLPGDAFNQVGWYLANKYALGTAFRNPLDVSPVLPVTEGLLEHFDADALTGVASGDTPAAWRDLATDDGVGQDAAVEGNPLLVSNAVNGRAVLRFDGVDDGFRTSLRPGIAANEGFTYVVVARSQGPPVNGAVTDGSGDYLIDRHHLAADASQNGLPLVSLKAVSGNYGYQTRYDDGSGLGGPVSTTSISGDQLQIVAMRRNTADSQFEIWVNGVLEATMADSGSALTPDPIVIGSHSTTPANSFLGDIAEVLVYRGQLSEQQFNDVGFYLEQKYALDTAYQGPGGSTLTSSAITTTVVIEGVNDAPLVDAGGPYTIDEGQSLSLNGSFTDVDANDTHVVGWDLNGDNSFSDAAANQTLTWADLNALGLDDGGSPGAPTTITLRVDDGTEIVEQPAMLIINNVAPTLTLTGPGVGVANGPIQFAFSTSDPSPADVLAGFTYQINWGDGQTETITAGEFGTLTHTYSSLGFFNVQVVVADQDGGVDTASALVDIQPVGLIGDDIYIGGTDAVNDRIIIQTAGRERLFVRYNDRRYGPFDILATSTVFAYGGGGQDRISVTSCVNTELHGDDGNDALYGGPCDDVIYGGAGRDIILTGDGNNWVQGDSGSDTIIGRSGDDVLNGGAGNDNITGSSGHDILRGESGNDSLVGGQGNDLLVGGLGNDKMFGQGGQDVLIGGDGNDQIRGGDNDDLLLGGFGLDGVRAERGQDVLAGGSAENEEDDAALLNVLLEWTLNSD